LPNAALMITSVMMPGTSQTEVPVGPTATLAVPVNTEAKMTRNSTGSQREEPGLPVAEERARVVTELMPR
jgi:hypothetical protein